jgi:hypothetical protein
MDDCHSKRCTLQSSVRSAFDWKRALNHFAILVGEVVVNDRSAAVI